MCLGARKRYREGKARISVRKVHGTFFLHLIFHIRRGQGEGSARKRRREGNGPAALAFVYTPTESLKGKVTRAACNQKHV